MSTRIKGAFILLGLASGLMFLWKFVLIGYFGSFYFKCNYFFSIRSDSWWAHIIGLLSLIVLGRLTFLAGTFLWSVYQDGNRGKYDFRFLDNWNSINTIIPGAWFLILLWFVNGNLYGYEYIGVQLEYEATENGTLKEPTLLFEKDDEYAIESYKNRMYADEDEYFEYANDYRFRFKTAGIFDGYDYPSDDYSGFGGFLLCFFGSLFEHVWFVLSNFAIPVGVFIIFREIEYKK